MELTHYLRFLRRNLALILATAVMAGGVAAAAAAAEPAKHEAHASLLITLKDSRPITDYDFDQFYTIQAADLYAANVVTYLSADDVAEAIRTQAGSPDGRLRSKKNGGAVQLTASAVSADQAANLITVAGKLVTDRARTLSQNPNRSNFDVTATATSGEKAVKPSTGRSTAAGGAAGVLLGLILALMRETVTRTIRGPEDLPSGLPVIAVQRRRSDDPEPYRELRERLVGSRIAVVADLTSRPGRTAVGLATAAAEAGRRVLLVDADSSRGVSELLGAKTGKGLAGLLSTAPLKSLIRPSGIKNVSLIPAGSQAAAASSESLARRGPALARAADLVVVASGGEVSAWLAWHTVADGLVLALERDRTPVAAARRLAAACHDHLQIAYYT
jgi:receptor protein-tyrosine kinase